MEALLLLKALVLGLVEGLTEFLPVSSTGHLIVAGRLLGFEGERAKLFEIVIQSGAILAIVIEYRARLLASLAGLATSPRARGFWINIAIAFIPAGLVGLLCAHWIKEHLFHAIPVACAFLGGAIVIFAIERRPSRARVMEVDAIRPLTALKIGLVQVLALIPGMSRSGTTIIGGLVFGLSRSAATEFSFFLAIPTLLAATGYSLWHERALLTADDLPLWLTGLSAAFLSAFLCIRWLLRFVSRNSLIPFAIYRAAFALLILLTQLLGWIDWSRR